MAKVSIIGTGTWGIALGMMLAQNGHEVTAWSALPKEIEALRGKAIHAKSSGS